MTGITSLLSFTLFREQNKGHLAKWNEPEYVEMQASYIFIFLELPLRNAFAIGASAQKLGVRRFNMLHWLGVGIIHQAVQSMCNDRLG